MYSTRKKKDEINTILRWRRRCWRRLSQPAPTVVVTSSRLYRSTADWPTAADCLIAESLRQSADSGVAYLGRVCVNCCRHVYSAHTMVIKLAIKIANYYKIQQTAVQKSVPFSVNKWLTHDQLENCHYDGAWLCCCMLAAEWMFGGHYQRQQNRTQLWRGSFKQQETGQVCEFMWTAFSRSYPSHLPTWLLFTLLAFAHTRWSFRN